MFSSFDSLPVSSLSPEPKKAEPQLPLDPDAAASEVQQINERRARSENPEALRLARAI